MGTQNAKDFDAEAKNRLLEMGFTEEEIAGMDPRFIRQFELCPVTAVQDLPIHIIGAGSVGSIAALSLGKLGCGNMTIYDKDSFSPENIPVQMFPADLLGYNKAAAVDAFVSSVCDIKMTSIPDIFTRSKGEDLQGIVIAAVDNMDVRKMIWECTVENPATTLFIDPRTGAENLRLYVVDPHNEDHQAFYWDNWYPSSSAASLPCTGKAIIYNLNFIAGLISRAVAKFAFLEEIRPVETILDCRRLNIMKTDEVKEGLAEEYKARQAKEEAVEV
jgi:hypothetical protein